MGIKVTEVQKNVLLGMEIGLRYRQPRGSMERLEKKGLVSGDRKTGWMITSSGLKWRNK